MILTEEAARDAVCGESEDWEPVEEEVIGQRRWVTEMRAIMKYAPTGKHYEFLYDRGSTECQDDSRPFEYVDTFEPAEVRLREVTVEKWVRSGE